MKNRAAGYPCFYWRAARFFIFSFFFFWGGGPWAPQKKGLPRPPPKAPQAPSPRLQFFEIFGFFKNAYFGGLGPPNNMGAPGPRIRKKKNRAEALFFFGKKINIGAPGAPQLIWGPRGPIWLGPARSGPVWLGRFSIFLQKFKNAYFPYFSL